MTDALNLDLDLEHADWIKYRGRDTLDNLRNKKRMSWSPYEGPEGGTGWQNDQTGEVRYQEEKPGEDGDGKDDEKTERVTRDASDLHAIIKMTRDEWTDYDKMLGGLSYREVIEKYGDDRAGEIFDSIRKKRNRWDAAMKKALSLGMFTQEEAQDRGLRITGGEKYQKMPYVMYHVTTNIQGVVQIGLKTRQELAQARGKGLGGGPNDTISFTESVDIAKGIAYAMREALDVARGRITTENLVQRAKEGDGTEPFYDTLVEWMRGYPYDIQDSINGTYTASGSIMEGKPPDSEHSWEPHPDANKIDIGEGGYSLWRRKATPEEVREKRWNVYKKFAALRESIGGRLDPLFYMSDVDSFAQVNPEQMKIVRVRPRPKALGYKVSALGEWRTHTGEAVEVTGTLPFAMSLE